MTITKKPKWSFYETRRNVPIYQRHSGTGTSQGMWMTPGTYFNTLKAAREYIDALPAYHVVAPNCRVDDSGSLPL